MLAMLFMSEDWAVALILLSILIKTGDNKYENKYTDTCEAK